jgi:hypothetical protein
LQPGQKPEIVPSKSEALDIIRDKQSKSPATTDMKTTITEVSTYLTANKIKNIIINENSSFQDAALIAQIDRLNDKNQYILSVEQRNWLKAKLKMIDAARANR